MKLEASDDLSRGIILVVVIGALLAGSIWTLLPFLSSLVWATTIALATWPLLLRLQRILWGRRSLAAIAMTLLVLLAFVIPFIVAIDMVLQAANRSPAVIQDFLSRGLGAPPDWLTSIPLFGAKIGEKWRTLAAGGSEALTAAIRPYAEATASWAVVATGGLGKIIVLFLLTVIIVAILYAQGEIAAKGVLAFARRLGGQTGEQTMRLAGQSVRSVALGVVVTALAQSLLTGLGLWVCSVPHAVLLTAIAFMLTIAQLGPLLILAGSTAWLYWTGQTGWATALLIWTIFVTPLDNIVRPILIRRSVQLPLLLIFAGVIGGVIGFGVVGLFVGPVILASTYTLAKEWVSRADSNSPESSGKKIKVAA